VTHCFNMNPFLPVWLLKTLMTIYDLSSIAIVLIEHDHFDYVMNIGCELPTIFIHGKNFSQIFNGRKDQRVLVILFDSKWIEQIPQAFFEIHNNLAFLLQNHHVEEKYQDLPLNLDSKLISYDQINLNSYKIFEYYKINKVFPVKLELGLASSFPSQKFTFLTHPFMWERRKNLQGITLRNSALNWNKVNNLFANGTKSGLFPQILDNLQNLLNFSTLWTSPEDQTWGGFNKDTGQWEGIIGDLYHHRADLGVSGLTISPERSLAVDFSFGVQENHITIMLGKNLKRKKINIEAYVNMFQYEFWVAYAFILVGIICLISTSLAYLMDKKISLFNWHRGLPHSLVAIFFSLLQLDSRLNTSTRALKVLFLLMAGLQYLVFQLYISDLTAKMTVSKVGEGITSFNDLLNQEYKILVYNGTWPYFILKGARANSPMKRAFDEITIPVEYQNGQNIQSIEQMIEESEESLAFYGTSLANFEILQEVKHFQDSIAFHLGIAFQKGSDLRQLL
jgi:ABC-type amino acid transport substrate-binding protein